MTPIRLATRLALGMLLASCAPKPTLGNVDVGTRTEPKGPLLPGARVESAEYLGCDVRFENLLEGDQIKIEWRYKESESSAKDDWHTSKRETVTGTGNGTLHADLGSDTDEIDPGLWECSFHLFASGDRKVGTADASGRIVVVGRKEDE